MPMVNEHKRKPGRPTGKDRIETSWTRLPTTQTGNHIRIQFYVTKELRDRMERVAPMLIEMEKNTKGGGITKNTPGKFCEYCAETMTIGLEKIIDEMLKQGENDAITSTSHNNG